MSSPAPLRALLASTLRGLVAPRRAWPLALLGGTLLVTEWFATHSVVAVALDLALLASFVLCAPALWRVLTARGTGTREAELGRVAVFLAFAIGVVGLFGLALPPLLGVRWSYLADPSAFGVMVSLFVVGGWGLGRDLELEEGVRTERTRAEKLGVEAERAQLLALRSQLDAHFLFNTLNAIAEWCQEDARVAERATLGLASVLRGIFEAGELQAWPLAREVALLEQLGALYAARDPERYTFRFELDANAAPRPIPPLLLLPLFENAIKHGPAAGHTGIVRVAVRADAGGEVTVEVRNEGAFTGLRAGGRGLPLAERRLALAYGPRAVLTLRSEGTATVATLRLPGASEAGSNSPT